MLLESIETGVDVAAAQWQARVDLAASHRLAVMHGFNEGIFNHFTLRVPGTNDRYYQIPFGLHWSEVTASCFMEVGYDGKTVWRRSPQGQGELPADDPRSRAILKKVLTGDNGIVTRHLALDNLNQAFELTPDTLHARFIKTAPVLASQAAQRALTDAGNRPDEMDALLISTCTGYLCPGLTSYVSERLGLRQDVMTLGPQKSLVVYTRFDGTLDASRCRGSLSGGARSD